MLRFNQILPVAALVCTLFASPAAFAAVYTCQGSNDGTGINALIDPPNNFDLIEIAAGDCLLDIAILIRSGVTLRGAGIGQTTLTVADSANSPAINGVGTISDVSISNLSIEGNRTKQVNGKHGIRFASTAANKIRIHDIEIANTSGYGMGFQTGSFTEIFIENVTITNTRVDGIDFKNVDSTNSEIFISNVHVSYFGREENGDVVNGKAGIDIRGQVLMNNIWVTDVEDGLYGIRFRPTSVPHGIGGRRSSLTNFRIAGSSGVGVSIEDRENNVSNGYIRGTRIGLSLISSPDAKALNNSVSSVECGSCLDTGLETVVQTGASDTMRNRIIGFRSETSGGDGMRIAGSDNLILGSMASGSVGNGLHIESDATRTVVQGTYLLGNGTNLLDEGSLSEIW